MKYANMFQGHMRSVTYKSINIRIRFSKVPFSSGEVKEWRNGIGTWYCLVSDFDWEKWGKGKSDIEIICPVNCLIFRLCTFSYYLKKIGQF